MCVLVLIKHKWLCCRWCLIQIHPGHAILEGRKPALLDSLVQVRPTCGLPHRWDEMDQLAASSKLANAELAVIVDITGSQRLHQACVSGHQHMSRIVSAVRQLMMRTGQQMQLPQRRAHVQGQVHL
jgi:hypothetical protein